MPDTGAILSHIGGNVQLESLNIFLSTPPERAQNAAETGLGLSLMAYRIGRGFHLYRTSLPPIRPVIMDIDCAGFTGYGPQELLAAEIVGECVHMGYSGVCLGLEGKPTRQTSDFCALLGDTCRRYQLTLYLPQTFASACDSSVILIPGQNTSGTFEKSLTTLCGRYGPERLALELERVYTDYSIPCPSGAGSILSNGRFQEVCASPAFYSQALCTNYASYMSPGGQVHLVLWDDAVSLRGKLAAARAAGISAAFLYYPHVEDILGEITVGHG